MLMMMMAVMCVSVCLLACLIYSTTSFSFSFEELSQDQCQTTYNMKNAESQAALVTLRSSCPWHDGKLSLFGDFFGPAVSQFPDQGLNLHPLQQKCRVLATGPPGKSLSPFVEQCSGPSVVGSMITRSHTFLISCLVGFNSALGGCITKSLCWPFSGCDCVLKNSESGRKMI